jgi:hypothetical protein
MPNLKFLKDVGYSHIYALDDDDSAFSLVHGLITLSGLFFRLICRLIGLLSWLFV